MLYFNNLGVYIEEIYSFFLFDIIIEFMVCVESENGIFFLYISIDMFVVIFYFG